MGGRGATAARARPECQFQVGGRGATAARARPEWQFLVGGRGATAARGSHARDLSQQHASRSARTQVNGIPSHDHVSNSKKKKIPRARAGLSPFFHF